MHGGLPMQWHVKWPIGQQKSWSSCKAASLLLSDPSCPACWSNSLLHDSNVELKERVGRSLVIHLASAVVEAVYECMVLIAWAVCPLSDTFDDSWMSFFHLIVFKPWLHSSFFMSSKSNQLDVSMACACMWFTWISLSFNSWQGSCSKLCFHLRTFFQGNRYS